MHNWILNGLLMTLAGASQQHCCVFYTHKYISIRLGSCMYYSQVNCRLKVNYIRKIWVSLPTAQLAVKHWPEKESSSGSIYLYLSPKYSFPFILQMKIFWKKNRGFLSVVVVMRPFKKMSAVCGPHAHCAVRTPALWSCPWSLLSGK